MGQTRLVRLARPARRQGVTGARMAAARGVAWSGAHPAAVAVRALRKDRYACPAARSELPQPPRAP